MVRDIIKPATEARGRRRFAELDEVAPHTGPATVFMSHCWGSEWGGLVMAASAGARKDRVVWIDVFAVRARAERVERGGKARRRRRVTRSLSLDPLSRAQVRQWPGNGADLDFRPVVRDATAFLLVAKHMEEVAAMEDVDAMAGKVPEVAFKECAYFRIWCVVELGAAAFIFLGVVGWLVLEG